MVAKRISANARAAGGSIKFIAYVIIILVVLYSDVMFVSLMWSAFPGGFLTIAAVGGAFATGLSIIALVIGKSHWFRPGGQLIWAWIFTGIEVALSIMNVVLSVMVAHGTGLGYLSAYLLIAPATPIVALVGWIVILYLDVARAQLHEDMEMDDDMSRSEREHKRQVHDVRMDLKSTALEQQREYLKMHLSSAPVQQALSEGSYEIARSIVSEIVQRPIMPQLAVASTPALQLPNAKTVESEDGLAKLMEKIKQSIDDKLTVAPAQPAQKVTVKPPFSPVAKKKLPPMHHAKKKNRGPYVVNKPMAAASLANEQEVTKPAIQIKKEEKTYTVKKPLPKLKLND